MGDISAVHLKPKTSVLSSLDDVFKTRTAEMIRKSII